MNKPCETDYFHAYIQPFSPRRDHRRFQLATRVLNNYPLTSADALRTSGFLGVICRIYVAVPSIRCLLATHRHELLYLLLVDCLSAVCYEKSS